MHDTEKDSFTGKERVREYAGPIYWNYGMLPQTFEPEDDVESYVARIFQNSGNP